MEMETLCSSESSINITHSIRRHCPKGSDVNITAVRTSYFSLYVSLYSRNVTKIWLGSRMLLNRSTFTSRLRMKYFILGENLPRHMSSDLYMFFLNLSTLMIFMRGFDVLLI
jgi:hypothetical protein